MSGNYPDVPAPRMAYDRDGTVGLLLEKSSMGSVTSQLSSGTLLDLNRESAADYTQNQALCLIFPELRNITGIFVDFGSAGTGSQATCGSTQWSANTTNGIDGTWAAVAVHGQYYNDAPIGMRNNISSFVQTGVKGIRIPQGGGGAQITFRAVHLYGVIAAGQSPDRLRLWHPTLDQELTGASFDWGDVPRSSSADRGFRVKNNSAALTASTITTTIASPSDGSPSVAGQHTFSTDGVNFSGSAAIASLAPGAISSVITLRRVTPSNAALSLWTARVIATAAAWA